jgi:hypothetical protein
MEGAWGARPRGSYFRPTRITSNGVDFASSDLIQSLQSNFARHLPSQDFATRRISTPHEGICLLQPEKRRQTKLLQPERVTAVQ